MQKLLKLLPKTSAKCVWRRVDPLNTRDATAAPGSSPCRSACRTCARCSGAPGRLLMPLKTAAADRGIMPMLSGARLDSVKVLPAPAEHVGF